MNEDIWQYRKSLSDNLTKRINTLTKLRDDLKECHENKISKIISDLAWNFYVFKIHYQSIEEILKEES